MASCSDCAIELSRHAQRGARWVADTASSRINPIELADRPLLAHNRCSHCWYTTHLHFVLPSAHTAPILSQLFVIPPFLPLIAQALSSRPYRPAHSVPTNTARAV